MSERTNGASIDLPLWSQTAALGLSSAEHSLKVLAGLWRDDEELHVEADLDCYSAMALALTTVEEMRHKPYQDRSSFEHDWYQVAAVVSLATRGFSGCNGAYARTLASLEELMRIVPELVEHAWHKVRA